MTSSTNRDKDAALDWEERSIAIDLCDSLRVVAGIP